MPWLLEPLVGSPICPAQSSFEYGNSSTFDFAVYKRHYGNYWAHHCVKHGAVLFESVWTGVFNPTVWLQDKRDKKWPLFSVRVLSVQVCVKLM